MNSQVTFKQSCWLSRLMTNEAWILYRVNKIHRWNIIFITPHVFFKSRTRFAHFTISNTYITMKMRGNERLHNSCVYKLLCDYLTWLTYPFFDSLVGCRSGILGLHLCRRIRLLHSLGMTLNYIWWWSPSLGVWRMWSTSSLALLIDRIWLYLLGSHL